MFKAKTERIEKLAKEYPERIEELEKLFAGKTNVYIDFANVLGWQDRLNWHISLKRLKQLFDSFDSINDVNIYYGTLSTDKKSLEFIQEIKQYGYKVITKPVKILKLSIDVSSISKDSPDILKNFIRKPLLNKLKVGTIEYLNNELAELNKQKSYYIEDLKCNFDVEIGRDMLLDYDKNGIETFILWSGDSDFADPIEQLIKDGKNVMIFATVRQISTELSNTKAGILDIKKIKEFICWPREIPT